MQREVHATFEQVEAAARLITDLGQTLGEDVADRWREEFALALSRGVLPAALEDAEHVVQAARRRRRARRVHTAALA